MRGHRGAQLDADAAWVGPVFGVEFVGLEGDGELLAGGAGGLEGIDEGAGEGVGDGEGEGHAAALGVAAGGVEVDGVEGLVGSYGFFVGLWGCGWWWLL